MGKLWLLTLLITFSRLNAQVAKPKTDGVKEVDRRAPERFMSGQIKHISDFIDQFNDAIKAGGNGEAALKALFNEDDPRFPGQGRILHPYASQVDAFVRSVAAEKVCIPKRGVMSAAVGLKVNYNGTRDTLTVHLRKDYTPDSAAYWHITKVDTLARLTERLGNTRGVQVNGQRIELPPNANEVSFLPLLRGLDDYRTFAPFTHCLECRDAGWQKAENALQNGRMKAEAVISNRIYLVAGNWVLELSEFIREKENSGWLVSNLMERSSSVK